MIAKPWTIYVCRSLDDFDWFMNAIKFEIKEDEYAYIWRQREAAIEYLDTTGCVVIELDGDLDTYFSSLGYYNNNKEHYDLVEVSSLMPIVIPEAALNELLGVG